MITTLLDTIEERDDLTDVQWSSLVNQIVAFVRTDPEALIPVLTQEFYTDASSRGAAARYALRLLDLTLEDMLPILQSGLAAEGRSSRYNTLLLIDDISIFNGLTLDVRLHELLFAYIQQENDPELREHAAKLYARHTTRETFPGWLELESELFVFTGDALIATELVFRELGSSLFPTLDVALCDERPAFRLAAVHALMHIPTQTEGVLSRIERMKDDPDDRVRNTVQQFIEWIQRNNSV